MSSTKFTVKTINGSAFDFDLSLDDTVGNLKALLAERSEVPVDKQRVIFKGKVLRDEQTLADAGVSEKAVLHLVEVKKPAAASSTSSSSGASPASVHEPPPPQRNAALDDLDALFAIEEREGDSDAARLARHMRLLSSQLAAASDVLASGGRNEQAARLEQALHLLADASQQERTGRPSGAPRRAPGGINAPAFDLNGLLSGIGQALGSVSGGGAQGAGAVGDLVNSVISSVVDSTAGDPSNAFSQIFTQVNEAGRRMAETAGTATAAPAAAAAAMVRPRTAVDRVVVTLLQHSTHITCLNVSFYDHVLQSRAQRGAVLDNVRQAGRDAERLGAEIAEEALLLAGDGYLRALVQAGTASGEHAAQLSKLCARLLREAADELLESCDSGASVRACITRHGAHLFAGLAPLFRESTDRERVANCVLHVVLRCAHERVRRTLLSQWIPRLVQSDDAVVAGSGGDAQANESAWPTDTAPRRAGAAALATEEPEAEPESGESYDDLLMRRAALKRKKKVKR